MEHMEVRNGDVMLHRMVVRWGMSSEVCMAVLLEVVQVLMDVPIHVRIQVALQMSRCSEGAAGHARGSGHGGAHGVFYWTVCLPAAEASLEKQDTTQKSSYNWPAPF